MFFILNDLQCFRTNQAACLFYLVSLISPVVFVVFPKREFGQFIIWVDNYFRTKYFCCLLFALMLTYVLSVSKCQDNIENIDSTTHQISDGLLKMMLIFFRWQRLGNNWFNIHLQTFQHFSGNCYHYVTAITSFKLHNHYLWR